jgi:hypothetical protein
VSDLKQAREEVVEQPRGLLPVGELRPGYANFAIDDPPLKLVLNSPGNGLGGTINHLGVEVGSTGEVTQAGTRLDAEGLDTEPEPGAVCCYARQDKV